MNVDPLTELWRIREKDPSRLCQTGWPVSEALKHNPAEYDEELGIRWSDGTGYFYTKPMERVAHQFNSLGFHGPEFVDQPDIVTLGCSMTNGIGLPHNFTWPHIISHITGQTVNNISEHGQGCVNQFLSLLGHNAAHGKPKKIFWLVTPLDRFYFALPAAGTTTFQYSADAHAYIDHAKPITFKSIDGTPAFIPINVGIHQNLIAIDQTIFYCEGEKIDLRLNSWSRPTLNALVKDYHHIGIVGHKFGWVQDGSREAKAEQQYCGCGLKPQNSYQSDFWNAAKDTDDGRDSTTEHPGLHSQLHFAELFLEREITTSEIADITPFWAGTEIENKINA